MKFFIVLATLLSVSLANRFFDFDSLDLTGTSFELDRNLVDEFLEKYEEAERLGDDSGITAVVNEYADKIFVNIQAFALSHNFDPISLSNVSEEFLTASIDLTNGLLHGISTINRSSDVEVSYHSSIKEMDFFVPIEFTNLSFTYDYHVIILLIGPKGGLTGKIHDFRMDVELAFNFTDYHAEIIQTKTTNSGQVTLTFSGNGIVDAVVNVLSEFVTTILHPVIVLVIEAIVSNVAKLIVNDVNEVIDSVLHPSVSTTDIIDAFF